MHIVIPIALIRLAAAVSGPLLVAWAATRSGRWRWIVTLVIQVMVMFNAGAWWDG